MAITLYLTLLFSITTSINAANILAITPFPSLTHSTTFVPLFQKLANHHNITVITPNPNTIHPASNIQIIDVSEVYHHQLPTESIEAIAGHNIAKHHEVFRVVVQNPDVRDLLLDKKTKFDLVMADPTSPIWTIFGKRFSCPVIGLLPYDVYLVQVRMGTPTNPAVHWESSFGFNLEINTFERIKNMFLGLLLLANEFFYTQQKVDYYLEEYFPKLPETIGQKPNLETAMLFVDQIPGFHKLRSTYENVKYIGSGPKYSQNYYENQKLKALSPQNKLIIVFLELPNEMEVQLNQELQKLNETILWVKHGNLSSYITKNNVDLIEPFEFQDILGTHPIDLLITNGDNHAIEISLQFEVPMLVIPRPDNGQEMQNSLKLSQENLALVLAVDNIDKTVEYITELFQRGGEYRKLIKNYAISIRTPLSGMRNALISIEWLLEHRQSLNLDVISSPTLKLTYAESWFLDMATLLVVSVIIAMFVILFLGSKWIEFITQSAAAKELVY